MAAATRSKVKSRSHYDVAYLQPLLSINFLHFTVSEILPGKNFKGQGHFSKVKSRSHHTIAQLELLTNVPIKYQLPTPYSF